MHVYTDRKMEVFPVLFYICTCVCVCACVCIIFFSSSDGLLGFQIPCYRYLIYDRTPSKCLSETETRISATQKIYSTVMLARNNDELQFDKICTRNQLVLWRNYQSCCSERFLLAVNVLPLQPPPTLRKFRRTVWYMDTVHNALGSWRLIVLSREGRYSKISTRVSVEWEFLRPLVGFPARVAASL